MTVIVERLKNYARKRSAAHVVSDVPLAYLAEAADRIEQQDAELTRLRAERAWQPIESAPVWGAYLVTNAKGEVCSCQSGRDQRLINNLPGVADWTWSEPATHWQPLPAPPAAGGE